MPVDSVLFLSFLNPTPLYLHKTELSKPGVICGLHCIKLIRANWDAFLLINLTYSILLNLIWKRVNRQVNTSKTKINFAQVVQIDKVEM